LLGIGDRETKELLGNLGYKSDDGGNIFRRQNRKKFRVSKKNRKRVNTAKKNTVRKGKVGDPNSPFARLSEVEFLSRYKGNVSFEITPQHLTISSPQCYKLLGSLAQMNPPIREKKHQDMLWKAVKEGVADTIGSDHAPHSLENKKKEYPQTPSGMPGVQTLVPLMLNHVNNNKLTLNQFIKLVCENPVRIFGIKNKGYIKEGYDADLTIVDMNMKKVIKNDWIASKCGWTPFDGYEVKGFPLGTIVNGKAIVWDGKLVEKANGKPLKF